MSTPPDAVEQVDDALKQAARSAMASEQVEQMEILNLKQQRGGLTPDERQALAQMLRRYEHVMLVRAKAAALLKERGYNVLSPDLLDPYHDESGIHSSDSILA